MSDERTITRSSGNIFADPCLPDATGQLSRHSWSAATKDIIREHGLESFRQKAARILDVVQPDLTNLLQGRFHGYSVERLMRPLSV